MICKCPCHTLNNSESQMVSLNCMCCETCPKCLQYSVDEEHLETCNVISVSLYKKKN